MTVHSFSPSPGRSRIMRAIHSKDTRPELAVRGLLCEIGFKGYRLHRSDLPGKPDIAFIKKKKAIFVHGCFWHGHSCPVGLRRPKVNINYWSSKIEGNRIRDSKCCAELSSLGWSVLVVWECEIKDIDVISLLLKNFMIS